MKRSKTELCYQAWVMRVIGNLERILQGRETMTKVSCIPPSERDQIRLIRLSYVVLFVSRERRFTAGLS